MGKQFFTKNGKSLKGFSISGYELQIDSLASESITTLFEDAAKSRTLGKLEFIKNLKPAQILESEKIQRLKKLAKTYIPSSIIKQKYAVLGASVGLFLTFFGIFVGLPIRVQPSVNDEYFIYSSKPLTIESASFEIDTRDSRAHKINEVFKSYSCPLEGMGDVFVAEADKNNIPWWLVASVAFQESSCGKKTPVLNGQESYNAWGWGVYGSTVTTFENWARGIETVSKYFGDKFYAKGVTDTCDIMKTYTPPSNGSWCNGVNHFAEVFQSYKSPTTNTF